jgi:hypothetical protein
MSVDRSTDIRENKLKKKDPNDPFKIITPGLDFIFFH